jgi:hypothetical protein
MGYSLGKWSRSGDIAIGTLRLLYVSVTDRFLIHASFTPYHATSKIARCVCLVGWNLTHV